MGGPSSIVRYETQISYQGGYCVPGKHPNYPSMVGYISDIVSIFSIISSQQVSHYMLLYNIIHIPTVNIPSKMLAFYSYLKPRRQRRPNHRTDPATLHHRSASRCAPGRWWKHSSAVRWLDWKQRKVMLFFIPEIWQCVKTLYPWWTSK